MRDYCRGGLSTVTQSVTTVCGRFLPRIRSEKKTICTPAPGGVMAVGVPGAMKTGEHRTELH